MNIPTHSGIDYNEQPFLAIWEVTQACDLACKHCRAAAQPIPHDEQLTTEEGKDLLDQIAELKVPVFIMTGGDPLKRKDVFDLVRYGTAKGIHMAMTPSATPLLTRDIIFQLKEAGLQRLAVSLDGSTAEIHDSFRGVPGTYDRTIQAIHWANEAGLPIQVHTTVSRYNRHDLDNVAALMASKNIAMWNVFFLVPVGRGVDQHMLNGEEFEQVFAKLYELSKKVPFQIKTTEAMHYRRYLLQRNVEERKQEKADHPESAVHRKNIGWATQRVNDGKGFIFISHKGEIYPSGFLAIQAGNLRTQKLSSIYREAPVLRALRDTSLLEGKCGACEYKEICGGSRARAYAVSGNLHAQETCCIYQPRGYTAGEPVHEELHAAAGA